jgi:hypothetical protein
MGNKLALLLKQAALQFVRAGNPADEYFLIEFGRTTANCI